MFYSLCQAHNSRNVNEKIYIYALHGKKLGLNHSEIGESGAGGD
jgi:hypothetical protein